MLSHEGMSRDEVLAALAAMRTDDRDWRNGRCFALVFHAGSEVEEIARAVLHAGRTRVRFAQVDAHHGRDGRIRGEGAQHRTADEARAPRHDDATHAGGDRCGSGTVPYTDHVSDTPTPDDPNAGSGDPFGPFGIPGFDPTQMNLADLMRFLQSEGPVNWEIAHQTAGYVALDGADEAAQIGRAHV